MIGHMTEWIGEKIQTDLIKILNNRKQSLIQFSNIEPSKKLSFGDLRK